MSSPTCHETLPARAGETLACPLRGNISLEILIGVNDSDLVCSFLHLCSLPKRRATNKKRQALVGYKAGQTSPGPGAVRQGLGTGLSWLFFIGDRDPGTIQACEPPIKPGTVDRYLPSWLLRRPMCSIWVLREAPACPAVHRYLMAWKQCGTEISVPPRDDSMMRDNGGRGRAGR